MAPFAHRRDPAKPYRVGSAELFYDLVFVFAITQVTHFLLEHLTWMGALQSLIILLVVWWAWQYTTWVTNELDPDATPIRLVLIVLMMGSLLMAIAIPEAFGDKAMLFAASYVFMQVGRNLFLTFIAAERGTVERSRAAHVLNWFSLTGILWIYGATLEGDARVIVWLIAAFIESSGPLATYYVPWLKRLSHEAWEISTSHFTERFQLFTIIALGESIVLTGATTSGLELDAARILAFSTAFFGTVALWWLYFNYVATTIELRLSQAEDTILTARDAFVYGHFPVIAGIVLSAVGDEIVIAHPTHHLETAALIAVVAGPALYLLSFIPMRLRMAGSLPMPRVIGAGVCVLIGVFAEITHVDALVVAILLVLTLVGVILLEARNRPRHRAETA